MIKHSCNIRVRYGETDQMGYLYYGNYAQYYEVARVELLRFIGYPYKQMEADGIMCPVISLETQYFAPAHYDENLRIETHIPSMPNRDVYFITEIYNEKNKLINKGKVRLFFVNTTTLKPRRIPDKLALLMAPYFNE